MFEDLQKQLESFTERQRAIICKQWIREAIPVLINRSKQLNPFLGVSKKSVFGANVDKKQDNAVSIWGARPNIGQDPQMYPQLPAPGWHDGQERRIYIGQFGIYRYSRLFQDHWKSIPEETFNGKKASSFFAFPDRKAGARVYGIFGNRNIDQIYSTRSMAEIVEQDPDLEDSLRMAFERAVLKARGI
jgi:hypothetical protein